MANLVRSPSTENQPLLNGTPLPHTSRPNRGGTLRWGFTFLGNGGTAAYLGIKAVEAFLGSRKSDGVAFALGAGMCTCACIYCCYRVVLSLKARQVEPIHSTTTIDHRMLLEINRRLSEMLPAPEEEDIELGNHEPSLHDSIEKQLLNLKALLPDLREKISELEDDIKRAMLQKSAMSSPAVGTQDSPVYAPDLSFENGLMDKLNRLKKTVRKDQTSTNSSRMSSTVNSPAGLAPSSVTSPPSAKISSPLARKIDFGPINDSGTPLSPVIGEEKK